MTGTVTTSDRGPAAKGKHRRTAVAVKQPVTAEQAKDRLLDVPAIDGLRAVAAIMVVAVHVWEVTGGPKFNNGAALNMTLGCVVAVDLLFMISGFVLFLPTVVTRRFGDVRRFALRRAARIVPLYYVVVIAVVVTLPLLAGPMVTAFSAGGGFASLALHLLFLQHSVGLELGYPEGWGAVAVLWTLPIEVCFYVVLPIIAVRFLRKPLLGLAISAAISLAWRYLAVSHIGPPGRIYDVTKVMALEQIPSFAFQFGMGMYCAYLFVWLMKRRAPWMRYAAIPVGAAGLATALWLMNRWGAHMLEPNAAYFRELVVLPIAAPFAAILLSVSLGPRWMQWPLTNALSRWLGRISYGIYLWHMPIGFLIVRNFGAARELGRASYFVEVFALVLVVTIALSSVTYLVIERPAIDWARTTAKRWFT
ncbi:acyltransferase [Skermania sp. ID1734]|uniref:acyltransferase family protein n=1 Tax=Skermania sp. ID1734 TaxID=2597516 RepID=UPI00117F7064|nr:acyltransferase [Skermania sp. ID1734]TSD97309.1 acyltransferase [Skermania sp. ID1734]